MEIVSIDREYLLKRALTSKYIGKGDDKYLLFTRKWTSFKDIFADTSQEAFI